VPDVLYAAPLIRKERAVCLLRTTLSYRTVC
jgi:hypothetical protein